MFLLPTASRSALGPTNRGQSDQDVKLTAQLNLVSRLRMQGATPPLPNVVMDTGWTTGVRFPAGPMIGLFLFSTASRSVLEPTQPLSNGYWGLLPWG